MSSTAEVPAVEVARIAAAAATRLPDVAKLHGGAVGEIATYGGGHRVAGVVVRGDTPTRVEVHVVVRYGRPLPEVGAQVQAAVGDELARHYPDRARGIVDVHVADVALPSHALPSHGLPPQQRRPGTVDPAFEVRT